MPGKRTTSRGSGGAGSSSQAKGAQGWKQINYASGGEVATRAEKKEATAKSKAAKKSAKPPTTRATRRKKPAEKPAAPPTRDTAIIDWVLGWPGHIKQGFAACILLFFTILLAVGLLMPPRSQNPLAVLGTAFYQLFGWGVYLLVIGLAALALANLAEAAAHIKLVRLGLLVQLTILGCLLILGSRLLLGGDTGQLFGALLIQPLAGLPVSAQKVAVGGAIIVLLLVIFRISWSQMLRALRWVFGGLGALMRASFGRLALALSAARARRAARKLSQAALEPEEEETSQPHAGSTSRPFPRLRQRAGDIALFDEDEDLASLAPQPGDTAAAAAGIQRPIRQALPVPTSRAASKLSEADDAALDDIPPLPPLPMKAGGSAQAAGAPIRKSPGRASGPLPAASAAPAIHYELPAITLLNGVVEQRQLRQEDMIEELARKVERTLRSFRVDAEVRRSDISVGPTVIRVGIRPVEKIKKDYRGHVVLDDEGEPVVARTRVSRIMALQNDLALDLEAKSIRMEAPVPGRPYV
ncbi:MAG TPA: DNA translocase FtsK, partial [Ktedonobacterales bacterium]|nr:DNA translocase FtsK [Ktedonobacterales bacterium]